MTENRTTELLREGLTERGVRWASKPTHPETTWSHDGWWYNAKFEPWSDSTFKVTIYDVTPEQAIAATLGNEREAELVRAMEDVLRHSTDTVWVGEAETLVDRMVSLGVYKHDVYEGARPWEVD